jgi:hypothetical protein
MIIIISESEIDAEHVDSLLKNSIKERQQGLCNMEMRMIEQHDEINGELWLASNECNMNLLNLVNILLIIKWLH